MGNNKNGLLGSILCSLVVILLCIYFIGNLAFNSDSVVSITRLLSEFESNGVISDLSTLTEELSYLKIPLINEINTGWNWLNPVISGLNMIIGFTTSIISFMAVIVVFILGFFSII